ncbi:MAG TPA: hypothetical protein VF547_04055, partial [Allosphingosinicella sp.]
FATTAAGAAVVGAAGRAASAATRAVVPAAIRSGAASAGRAVATAAARGAARAGSTAAGQLARRGVEAVGRRIVALEQASARRGLEASRSLFRPGSAGAQAAEGNALRLAGSRGVRNTEPLTPSQQQQVYRHVEELGLDPSDFHISSRMSAYSDEFDAVFIGPNAFPAPAASRVGGTVFERLSPRAVVAHEAGHMLTTRAGTSAAAGSVADEVGASLAAARLPGLNRLERYQLLRDAAERARNAGTTVRAILRGD